LYILSKNGGDNIGNICREDIATEGAQGQTVVREGCSQAPVSGGRGARSQSDTASQLDDLERRGPMFVGQTRTKKQRETLCTKPKGGAI
jgi:hypothetical protein